MTSLLFDLALIFLRILFRVRDQLAGEFYNSDHFLKVALALSDVASMMSNYFMYVIGNLQIIASRLVRSENSRTIVLWQNINKEMERVLKKIT